jgi:hypothetical protein
MTTNISTTEEYKTIIMRNGDAVHILASDTRVEEELTRSASGFIHVADKTINKKDIVEIIPWEDFKALEDKKSGGWRCESGNWHAKNITDCTCSVRDWYTPLPDMSKASIRLIRKDGTRTTVLKKEFEKMSEGVRNRVKQQDLHDVEVGYFKGRKKIGKSGYLFGSGYKYTEYGDIVKGMERSKPVMPIPV